MNKKYPALFYSYSVLKKVIKNKKFVRDVFENFSRNKEFTKNLPLITELVYGTLRYWHQIEFILSMLTKGKKIRDIRVKIILSLGIYQIKFTRIPERRAVFSTVEMSKKLFSKEIGNFVNAILKKFISDRNEIEKLIEELPYEKYIEVKYSFPAFFIKNINVKDIEKLLSTLNKPAPIYLKPVPGVSTVNEIVSFLNSTNAEYDVCDFPPGCVRVNFSTSLLLSRLGGKVIIQDRGAQVISWLLRGIPSRNDILDCCTAPGWKTLEILRNRENHIVVVEKSAKKLNSLKKILKEGNFNNVRIITDNIENFSLRNEKKFDFIVADVPCSNSGVVRRHPEKKLLLSEKVLFSLVSEQRKILSSIYKLLKNRGMLFYITCSLFHIENEDQINWLRNIFPDMELISQGYIYPFTFDSDGFFIVLLRKK